MTAIRMAEDLKNNPLSVPAYTQACHVFTPLVEDHDKAIDYQMKATDKLNDIKTGQTPYAQFRTSPVLATCTRPKKVMTWP